MNYFNSNDTSHHLKFIHRRFYPIVNVILTHELTNREFIIHDVECYLDNGYSYLNFNFEFIKGSYTIEIVRFNNLIYRGKAKAI